MDQAQEPGELTILLQRASSGDHDAENLLLDHVYSELHAIAVKVFSRERPGHSLQPSVLISEAFLRLLRGAKVDWQNTAHFYRTAARTFRRILLDHARGKGAKRRPHDLNRVELDETFVYSEDRAYEVIEISEALDLLERQDPELASLMELRYFSGYTNEETAEFLGLSVSTVKTKHKFALAWLKSLLEGSIQP